MWNQVTVRELVLALLIKLAAIYVRWLACFHQTAKRELTHHVVGQLLPGNTHSVTFYSQPR
jgi:hypothetical protein